MLDTWLYFCSEHAFPITTVLRVIKIQFYRIILQVVSDLAAKDGGGAKVSRYICCLTALENN